MFVDSTWLVGWPVDRYSSVIKKKSVPKLMDRTVYARIAHKSDLTYSFLPNRLAN